MATLLQNNIAPLWVWILIIVLGSLLISLVLSLVVWRLKIRSRRSARRDVEVNAHAEKRSSKHGKDTSIRSGRSRSGSRYDKVASEHGDAIDTTATRSHDRAIASPNRAYLSGSPSNVPELSPAPTYRTYQSPLIAGDASCQSGLMSSASSASEVTAVSKPLLDGDSPKANPVNFSRPQPRQSAQIRISKRLSVIRESTPTNSWYSRISRIFSASGSDRDSDLPEPVPQASQSLQTTEHAQPTQPLIAPTSQRISDRAPRVSLMLGSNSSQEDQITRSSPLDEALAEIQRLSATRSPEPVSRHPSGLTYVSDDLTMLNHSRSSSVTNFSRKQSGHNYNPSLASNAGPRPARGTRSRSSSVHNFSRKPYISDTEKQATAGTIASWAEAPKATLTEPFDSPDVMAFRESGGSMWSNETYQSPSNQSRRMTAQSLSPISYPSRSEQSGVISPELHSSEQQVPLSVATSSGALTSDARQDVSALPGVQRVLSDDRGRGTTWFDDNTSVRERGRSTESRRSRSSIQVTTHNGRQVLAKKRSSQRTKPQPEIRLIGSVDPSSLDHLSVRD